CAGARIGGGVGDENIPRAVTRVAAITAQSQGNFPGHAFQLGRNERRVGSDYHDDRANIIVIDRVLGNLLPHGNTGDPQLTTPAVVALHEYSYRVAAIFAVKHAGGGSNSAFEFIADHAGSAADVAFFDHAAVGGVESMKSICEFDMESVDVIQFAVPGFSNHWQRPPIAFSIGIAALHPPGNDRVTHHPH